MKDNESHASANGETSNTLLRKPKTCMVRTKIKLTEGLRADSLIEGRTEIRSVVSEMKHAERDGQRERDFRRHISMQLRVYFTYFKLSNIRKG